jgi:hypothetical protein
MLLALALMACTTDEASDSGDAVDLPSPYIVDEEEPPQPGFTGDELASAVQQALDEVIGINAEPIFWGYDAAMAGENDDCPSRYANEYGTYWFDQCTSDAGYSFSGYGFYYEMVDVADGDYIWNGEQLFGAALVTTADGHEFGAAGGAQHMYGVNQVDGNLAWQTYIQGTFEYDGPEATGTWLEGAMSPDFSSYAIRVPSVDGHFVSIDGGISGFDGDVSAVAFDQLAVGDANVGWPCEGEPFGMVSVRASDGHWYDVLFDGPDPASWMVDDPDLCDGCGAGYFRGEYIGDVCIDTTPLTGWGDAP